MLVQHVWKHHGLNDTAVSNRGPQFISKVQTQFCQILKIKPRSSTAFYPETDGQIENINKDIERYLRSFVNYVQNDWLDWLPIAEFAANNTDLLAIGTSPFFTNYGFYPKISFNFEPSIPNAPAKPRELIQREKAQAIAKKMEEINKFLKGEIALTQSAMEDQLNRHRTPAPRYFTGNKV